MAFAARAMAADQSEEAVKWLKLVTPTGEAEAFGSLARIYRVQGKMELWEATLEDSLKFPDFSLWHATVHTSIAHYHMQGKRWEKALPHAKAAAESYAAWGLEVPAECREAMHEWSEAEEIYKAAAERYPTSAVDWYNFCRRTGRGDLVAARSATAKVLGPTRFLPTSSGLAYYTLEKQTANEKRLLERGNRVWNPLCDMHLALLADEAHDESTRDVGPLPDAMVAMET